eukprot:GFUD01094497.1.p1 GENE.GFUD01094497.1~~GFUD01094497.1.p1  ORF type:complete len:339 (-),score=75.85 GFUD01094497.1:57-983(-)
MPYRHTQQYLQTSPYDNHTIQYQPMTNGNYNLTPPKLPYENDPQSVTLPFEDISPLISPSEGSYSYNQIDVPAQELYDYSIIKQGTQIPSPPASPFPANPALTCECPMCYHSCRNTCTICGCPNGTLNSQTTLKHVGDVSADIQTSSYSSHSSYPTVPSMQIRSSTPIQVTETLGHLNGKLKTLPSRSIQELYSQRKSSSPDILGYQRTFDGDPGRTNLYKPTSLQDFKKLLSQSSVAQYQHKKDLLDNIDREYNGAEKNTNTTFKNPSSLKKPSLWMDNRFSIIQEEPDLQEKRKSEEDLLQGGFIV